MIIDWVTGAFTALQRRWQRNALTAATITLSAAAVVFITSFAQTAAHQTAQILVALQGNTITASLPDWTDDDAALASRLRALEGIEEAGTLMLPGSGPPVRVTSGRTGQEVLVQLAVADEAGLRARGAKIVAGTVPSPIEATWPTSVLVGQRLARELGIADPMGAEVVIDGAPLGVAGIIADGTGGGALTTTVVMAPAVAERLGHRPEQRTVLMRVGQGDADGLINVLPLALHPVAPHLVRLTMPPSPRALQAQMAQQSRSWVMVTTGALAGVSALTIMVTLHAALQERRREVGIRRALGDSGASITARLCCEAVVLSTVAGLLGFFVGGLVIALVAALLGWPLVIPTLALWVPLGAVVIGGLASLPPSMLAQRVDPSELLRAM